MLTLIRFLGLAVLALPALVRLPRADAKAQWFAKAFPGRKFRPNVTVLHTTEGTDWPGYSGGATAPNLTCKPDIKAKALRWRQHFSLDESSRALRNLSGGVETNTLNAAQIELIGTCDPKHRKSWNGAGKVKAGRDYIFWPAAPQWALKQLGEALRDINEAYPAIKLVDAAPRGWAAYPSSYANGAGQRLSGAEWRKAVGILGHQHVPENVHGDPGNIDIERVLEYAGVEAKPQLTRGGQVDTAEAALVRVRRHAIRKGWKGREKAATAVLRQLRVRFPTQEV